MTALSLVPSPVPSRLLAQAEPLTRDGARDAARGELSRPEYAEAQPPLLLRLVGRVLRELGELLDRVAGGIGNGTVARLLLLAVLALVVVTVLVRLGPLGRQPRSAAVFGPEPARTAAGHRDAAERLAAEQRWAEAVRERLRAVVRALEERGVLDARPGRTAGEVARDGGAAVPELAGDLARAARTFDEVWYGGRQGTREGYAVLVEVDAHVQQARTVPA